MDKKEQDILKKLWNSIKGKRVTLNLSQTELSEKAWIDRSYISMVESWKSNITFLKLKKIEEVLGEIF